MKTIKLLVKTNTQKYPIIIGSKLIEKLSSILRNNFIEFEKCLFIIDENVPKKFILKIKKSFRKKKILFHILKTNERNKNFKTTRIILDILLKKNFSRQDYIIAVGGGITGDIAGFAASLFKRGLNFINIPTTLLSQVDSSVGGKTGINTIYGKNLIGSFYQPRLVITDSDFLKSLPKREIICGYGEILKHSIISDKNFFKFLEKNVLKVLNLESPFIEKAIFKSCKIKKSIIEKDEKEKNIRKILNFGHTFAHAYEATLDYSNKLNHGEAVLLGMRTALNFSLKNRFIKKTEYSLVIKHLINSKLPYNIKKYFSLKDLEKILSFMMKDKKNYSDNISLIILRKIGSPLISKNYTKNILRNFLRKELIN